MRYSQTITNTEKETKAKARRPGQDPDTNTLIFVNKKGLEDPDSLRKDMMIKLVAANYNLTDYIFSKELDPLNPKGSKETDSKEKSKKNIYWFKNSQKNYMIKRYGENYANLGRRKMSTGQIDKESLKSKLKEPTDINKLKGRAKDKTKHFLIEDDKYTTYKRHLLTLDAFEKALEGDKKVTQKKVVQNLELPAFSLKNSKAKTKNNKKLIPSSIMSNQRVSLRKVQQSKFA